MAHSVTKKLVERKEYLKTVCICIRFNNRRGILIRIGTKTGMENLVPAEITAGSLNYKQMKQVDIFKQKYLPETKTNVIFSEGNRVMNKYISVFF